MGSGARAYRVATGEYQALAAYTKAADKHALEQAELQRQFDLETYELQKSGKLPGYEEPAESLPGALMVTAPAKVESSVDYKILAVPAVLIYLIWKKR